MVFNNKDVNLASAIEGTVDSVVGAGASTELCMESAASWHPREQERGDTTAAGKHGSRH